MCAREWVNIERLKREMRGIPPMKAVSPAELDLMRARRAKVIADAATIEAEEVPKESLFQPPVTTPPTPMPPRGGGDLNNK